MKDHKVLNESELSALHSFVRSKYVEYYDIQIELVDHLATEIEGIWMKDENVSFESALSSVYKKFGIYGFSYIVLRKQLAVPRQQRHFWWQEFQTFFKLPRVGLSAIILLLVFVVYCQTTINLFLILNGACSLLLITGELIRRNSMKPSGNYKITHWQYSSSSTLMLNVFFIPYVYFMIRANVFEVSWHWVVPVAAFLSWIAFFASSLAFKKQMEKQIKMYPEAFA